MSVVQLLSWAAEALIASALLIVMVLALRVPVRRAFGAGVAYLLWLLPALRLVMPPVPATWRESVAPLTDVGVPIAVVFTPRAEIATVDAGWSLTQIVLAGWGAGAVMFLAWHVLSYLRFRRRILARAVLTDHVRGVDVIEAPGAAGPLAFGIARRFVAFPRDFAARYDADERSLALAHELGHHERGDLVANWVALAVLALHWFNPLAWHAFRAFRADQEMANDARVMARCNAAQRHAYACAIVKSAHGGAIGAACHLHNVGDLKNRLRMLATRPTRARSMGGATAVFVAGATALALSASGTHAAERVRMKMESAGATIASLDTLPASFTAQTPPAPPAPPATQPGTTHRIVVTRNGVTRTYEGAAADAYLADNPMPAPPAPPAAPAPPAPAVPADPRPLVVSQACAGEGPVSFRRVEGDAEVTVLCRNRLDSAIAAGARGRAEGERARAQAWAERDRVQAEARMERARALAEAHGERDRAQAEARAEREEALAEARAEREAAQAEAHAERAVAYGERARQRGLESGIRSLTAARSAMARNTAVSEGDRRRALAGMDRGIAQMRRDLGRD